MPQTSTGIRILIAITTVILVSSLAVLFLLQAGADESASCIRYVQEHELMSICMGPPEPLAFVICGVIAILAGLATVLLALQDRSSGTPSSRR